MSQNETGNRFRVMNMEIIRTKCTRRMTDRRVAREPAPASAGTALVVLESATARQSSGKSAKGSRPASAFLAQLAQQYDGVSARRTRRAQRLETAIESYGSEAPMGSNPHAQPTHDLKI